MPSADSCHPSQASRPSLGNHFVDGRLPQVRTLSFSIHSPHLFPATFGSKDLVLFGGLIQSRKAFAFTIQGFHPIDSAHAGRTKKGHSPGKERGR